MDTDPIDLKYARRCAEFLGSEHTEVVMTREDVLAALDRLVYLLGTYDITTIRASLGMYLVWQVHPRAHGRARPAHGRDIRRALRL